MANVTIISAVPGSGKTQAIRTRIEDYLETRSGRVIALAFAREAARELQERIGEHDRLHCSTIHSLAYSIASYTNEGPEFYQSLLRNAEERVDSIEPIGLLCVDEAQDLTKEQASFVRALMDKSSDVLIVGDPDQSIYGFNGAHPTHMFSLGAGHEVEKNEMPVTWRFGKHIAEFVNNAFSPAVSVQTTDKRSKFGIMHMDYPEGIIDLFDDHMETEDSALLFRTNQEIMNYLTRTRHSGRLSATVPMTANPVILLSCATILATTTGVPMTLLPDLARFTGFDDRKLRYVCRMGGPRPLTIDDIKRLSYDRTQNDVPIFSKARTILQNLASLMETIVDGLDPDTPDIDQVLARVEEIGFSPTVKLTELFSGISREEKLRGIRAFVSSGEPTMITTSPESSRHVMTMHAAKGREFSTVSVVGNGSIDIYSEEEFRVMYVACTRARDDLTVFVPELYERRHDTNVIDAINMYAGVV